LLEDRFRDKNDPIKIRYFDFNEEIEKIFTEKDLEKNPTKNVRVYEAPSILDPKDILSVEEEEELDACMQRIGLEVRNRRLLIKPFF
jgi:hypothetical protein